MTGNEKRSSELWASFRSFAFLFDQVTMASHQRSWMRAVTMALLVVVVVGLLYVMLAKPSTSTSSTDRSSLDLSTLLALASDPCILIEF